MFKHKHTVGRITVLSFFILMAEAVNVAGYNVSAASEIVFQGQNAALFPGANPSDTTALMSSVPKPTASTATQATSAASLIEQSIESQISSRIYNDIFTGTATSGYYDLGGGYSISFTRSGGYVTITITNPTTGTTTVTVPDT